MRKCIVITWPSILPSNDNAVILEDRTSVIWRYLAPLISIIVHRPHKRTSSHFHILLTIMSHSDVQYKQKMFLYYIRISLTLVLHKTASVALVMMVLTDGEPITGWSSEIIVYYCIIYNDFAMFITNTTHV